MNSVIFNTVSLGLSLVGICLCWIPGAWGWVGLALCALAVLIGVRGLTDRRCPGGAVGMDVAGNAIGGFALPWGAAFQIKHAAGGLDALLLPLEPSVVLAVAIASAVVFWASQIVGRFRARAFFLVLTTLATLSFFAFGATAWTNADRSFTADSPSAEVASGDAFADR